MGRVVTVEAHQAAVRRKRSHRSVGSATAQVPSTSRHHHRPSSAWPRECGRPHEGNLQRPEAPREDGQWSVGPDPILPPASAGAPPSRLSLLDRPCHQAGCYCSPVWQQSSEKQTCGDPHKSTSWLRVGQRQMEAFTPRGSSPPKSPPGNLAMNAWSCSSRGPGDTEAWQGRVHAPGLCARFSPYSPLPCPGKVSPGCREDRLRRGSLHLMQEGGGCEGWGPSWLSPCP